MYYTKIYDKNHSKSKIFSDIRLSKMCSSHLEASSDQKAEGVQTYLDFSVGVGAFVIGQNQISSLFAYNQKVRSRPVVQPSTL